MESYVKRLNYCVILTNCGLGFSYPPSEMKASKGKLDLSWQSYYYAITPYKNRLHPSSST
jgi:hypothetical protein